MDTTMRLGFGILVVGLVGLAPRTALAAEGGRKARTTHDMTSDVPEGTHQLLQLVNQERAAVGAPPIALREDLVSLAAGFSRQMAAERNLRHNADFLCPAAAARLGASRLGENVAVEPDIDTAHARLMESPGHRANILEPDFLFAGIAVTQGDDGALYVTEDFLAPSEAKAELKPAPVVPPPSVPRHRAPAHPSRAVRRPSAPPPTTPATPIPPAAATPPPASPPIASAPATVPLEPVAYVRAMPSPGSPAEGRHDAATFQLLVVGSALALTIRRVR